LDRGDGPRRWRLVCLRRDAVADFIDHSEDFEVGLIMKSIFFLSLTSILAAGALATTAAAEPVVAKLRAPLSGAEKPVAGGAVFECLGDVCAARAPTSESGGLRGCKDLVRQVGAVNSFGASAKALGSDELATCNESARK